MRSWRPRWFLLLLALVVGAGAPPWVGRPLAELAEHLLPTSSGLAQVALRGAGSPGNRRGVISLRAEQAQAALALHAERSTLCQHHADECGPQRSIGCHLPLRI